MTVGWGRGKGIVLGIYFLFRSLILKTTVYRLYFYNFTVLWFDCNDGKATPQVDKFKLCYVTVPVALNWTGQQVYGEAVEVTIPVRTEVRGYCGQYEHGNQAYRWWRSLLQLLRSN